MSDDQAKHDAFMKLMDETRQRKAALERNMPRRARREEIARELLLKLVENRPGVSTWDIDVNIAAAMEYTDKLLDELEKTNDSTDQ